MGREDTKDKGMAIKGQIAYIEKSDVYSLKSVV